MRSVALFVVVIFMVSISLVISTDYAFAYQDGILPSISSIIEVGSNPNNILVDSNKERVYVVNSHQHFISVIDGTTDKISTKIPCLFL